MSTFDNIKKFSKLRGYTLKETAMKSGLSENALYRYNQGIEPKYETLNKIATVLNVKVSDLSESYSDNTLKKDGQDLTENQKLIAYSIDPDVSNEEREAIIEMVKQAMKFRKRL